MLCYNLPVVGVIAIFLDCLLLEDFLMLCYNLPVVGVIAIFPCIVELNRLFS